MTRKQFRKKVNELLRENNRAIRQQAEMLFRRGCIDMASFADDYALPKMFLCAACINMAEQWKPLSTTLQKEVKNILHFI